MSMTSQFLPIHNSLVGVNGSSLHPSNQDQQFKSGLSSHFGDEMFRSDSIRAINESSFSRNSSRFERGGRGSLDNQQPGLTESFLVSQKEFSLYEQYTKGAKKFGLGSLYKVRLVDEEKQLNYQLLCRVIKFQRVKSYVIEEILKDAYNLR